MTHNHLSPTERYQIQAWLEQDLSKCQIALRLGRHRSTIYRELARCEGIYNAPQAQSHRSGCAALRGQCSALHPGCVEACAPSDDEVVLVTTADCGAGTTQDLVSVCLQ